MTIITARFDGRSPEQLRPITIERHYIPHAEGSCLISVGKTKVICTATLEEKVPSWMKSQEPGMGWITAEYAMIPRATGSRVNRERKGVGGRTAEIQRLIGRSLRSICDRKLLGERSITLDADVISADGGTRTASITGCYVALYDVIATLMKERKITENPLREFMAAVSVGIVNGRVVLDLPYEEDSAAQVDMNVVMTESGKYIEIQGTAEGHPFDRAQRDELLEMAEGGIRQLIGIQKRVLGL